jgi:hypothetical protein
MALMVLGTPCPWKMCSASFALQMFHDVASWQSRLQSPWSCRRHVHASYGLQGSIFEGSRFLAAHARSWSSGRDEHYGHDVREPHAGGGTNTHWRRKSCPRSPSPYICTASGVSPSFYWNHVSKDGKSGTAVMTHSKMHFCLVGLWLQSWPTKNGQRYQPSGPGPVL